MGGGAITIDEIKEVTDGSYICGSVPIEQTVLLKDYKVLNEADAKANAEAQGLYRANTHLYLIKKDKAPSGRSVYVVKA